MSDSILWKYAREATLAAYEATTEKEEDAWLELAATWIRAAVMEQRERASETFRPEHGQSPPMSPQG